jgi:hypothetical protein
MRVHLNSILIKPALLAEAGIAEHQERAFTGAEKTTARAGAAPSMDVKLNDS